MKKLSKIRLRTVEETLSEYEMKVVKGGYEEPPYGWSAGGSSPKEDACKGKKIGASCGYIDSSGTKHYGCCLSFCGGSIHCSNAFGCQ